MRQSLDDYRGPLDMEDSLFHARFQLGETLGDTDVFDIDTTVSRVEGCLISD